LRYPTVRTRNNVLAGVVVAVYEQDPLDSTSEDAEDPPKA